jgi:hypothetical protein
MHPRAFSAGPLVSEALVAGGSAPSLPHSIPSSALPPASRPPFFFPTHPHLGSVFRFSHRRHAMGLEVFPTIPPDGPPAHRLSVRLWPPPWEIESPLSSALLQSTSQGLPSHTFTHQSHLSHEGVSTHAELQLGGRTQSFLRLQLEGGVEPASLTKWASVLEEILAIS